MIIFQFKTRAKYDYRDWEDIPISFEMKLHCGLCATSHAQDLIARSLDVREIRLNEKHSLQGHYVSAGNTPWHRCFIKPTGAACFTKQGLHSGTPRVFTPIDWTVLGEVTWTQPTSNQPALPEFSAKYLHEAEKLIAELPAYTCILYKVSVEKYYKRRPA